MLFSCLWFLFHPAKSNLQVCMDKKQSEVNGCMPNWTTVKTFKLITADKLMIGVLLVQLNPTLNTMQFINKAL